MVGSDSARSVPSVSMADVDNIIASAGLRGSGNQLDNIQKTLKNIVGEIEKVDTKIEKVDTQSSANFLEIKQQIQGLDQRLAQSTLSAKTRSKNHERMKANQAKIMLHAEATLLPLLNPVTGLEIPSFPSNLGDLYSLEASEIEEILQILDIQTESNGLTTLRQALRVATLGAP
uniref:Uncharacterized protein n=1 Tax=Bionectria ochroleuca TaxID=29856 RepID=A0A8H7TSB7_BIOOC